MSTLWMMWLACHRPGPDDSGGSADSADTAADSNALAFRDIVSVGEEIRRGPDPCSEVVAYLYQDASELEAGLTEWAPNSLERGNFDLVEIDWGTETGIIAFRECNFSGFSLELVASERADADVRLSYVIHSYGGVEEDMRAVGVSAVERGDYAGTVVDSELDLPQ